MSTIQTLLGEIEEFLRDTEMAETTFGRHAVNDGKFVGRLRSGSGLTVATVDRVRGYIAKVRGARSSDVAADEGQGATATARAAGGAS